MLDTAMEAATTDEEGKPQMIAQQLHSLQETVGALGRGKGVKTLPILLGGYSSSSSFFSALLYFF